MPRPSTTSTTVRYMKKSDLGQAVLCEAWDDFAPLGTGAIDRLRLRGDTVGLVALDGDRIVAYALVGLLDDRLLLRRLAVRLDRRGEGIGRRLLRYVEEHKCHAARPAIEATVHERDDEAVAWLSRCGYRAVGVDRCHFGDRDGYRFRKQPNT
jgi:GNAT superfamily N-acetyltransferase